MTDANNPVPAGSNNGRSPIDWNSALREHEGWLRKVVRSRLGEADAVDDVMQNIALITLKGKTQTEHHDRIAPWLYRVAVKQCLMHRRTSGRQRRLTRTVWETNTDGSSAGDDPLVWLLGRERQASVRQALSGLGDLDRQILMLKHTEGWTYQQLADHLGVSVNTIEYRLLRARKRLRSELMAAQITEAHS